MNNNTSALGDFKRLLLEEERQDAQRRLADTEYWGDTGAWVNRAIVKVEQAIDGVPFAPDTRLDDWTGAVEAAIEAAHESFRKEEDDPDGYGSATFHAVRRRLAEFMEMK